MRMGARSTSLDPTREPDSNPPVSSKIRRVDFAAKRPAGRPKVCEKVVEIVIEILDAPDPPVWTKRIELQPYVRQRGMRKYPNEFDDQRPNRELIRRCINEALSRRISMQRA